MEEYDKREDAIVAQTRLLERLEQEMNDQQTVMTNVKNSWLEPLRKLISDINEKFSYFFSCLNCAGEVDLSIPPNSVSNTANLSRRFMCLFVHILFNEPLRFMYFLFLTLK